MNPSTANLFACVIPGRTVRTDFKQVSKTRFILNVPKPATIREFAISILKPTIPKGHGITIYFSLPPFKDWQYVGSITLSHPSEIYSAPWRGTLPANVGGLQLGLSIESSEFIKNLHPQSQYEEEKKLISSVQGIAVDLYNYLQSFAKTTRWGEMLVVPPKFLDKWLKKFETKHKQDPYFWLKKS
mmetsp:Transcript_15245/g.21423  ORF Transcript_15245/g.21423 Transcript_15245/m.21423 type:complete len:185 (+) Transcript_15245:151-705(+)